MNQKNKTVRLPLVIMIIIAGCHFPDNRNETLELIRRHQFMRPQMAVEDVYKLLYQRWMGAGHLITDTAAAKQYLYKELEMLDTNETDIREELVEPIAPDSSVVRINLRLFKKMNGSADRLFLAMLKSIAQTKPDSAGLKRDWDQFVTLNKNGHFGFESAQVDSFDAYLRSMNYPMVHHSRVYRMHYRPAYRILLRDTWEKYYTETKENDRNER